MASKRTILMFLLFSLPILATVISAFRVRDFPKINENSYVKVSGKCADCDSVSEPPKKHKTDNTLRSYEDFKKAVRDKQEQTTQNKGKVNIKFKNDLDKHKESVTQNKIEIKDKKDSKPKVLKFTPTFLSNQNDNEDDDLVKVTHKKIEKIVEVNQPVTKKEKSKNDHGASQIIASKETHPKSENSELKKSQSKNPQHDKNDEIDSHTIKPKEKKDFKPIIKIEFDDNDDDDDEDDDDNDDDKNYKKDNDDRYQISKKEVKIIKEDVKLTQSHEDHKKSLDGAHIIEHEKGKESDIKHKQEKPTERKGDVKPIEKHDHRPVEPKIIKEKSTKTHEDDDAKHRKKTDLLHESKKENIPEKTQATQHSQPKKIHDTKNKETHKPDPKPFLDHHIEKIKTETKHDGKQSKLKQDDEISKKENIQPEAVPTKTKDKPKEHVKPVTKKDDVSKEKHIDSSEISSKSGDHFKHVSDALQRKNLLQTEFEDLYAFFPTFAPNFSKIHNPECRRHGQILLRQLRGTKLWALNMLDATAKIPQGILQGNGIQLGDFDQCLGSKARVQLDTGTVVRVQGKYCLITIDVKAEHHELELPVHLAQAKNLIKSRIDDPGHFVPRFSTLSWGICVPDVCGPDDVEIIFKDAVKHYQHNAGLIVKVDVDEDDCHTDNDDDWWEEWMELPTLVTLSIYGIILLLVLIATAQDYLTRRPSSSETSRESDDKAECDQQENKEDNEEEKEEIKSENGGISSFSLYYTLRKLSAPGTDDEISCIHGVRAVATIALLIGHKFLAVGVTPYMNRLKVTEAISSPWMSWSRAGWMYTDCFLMLSATLTAHRINKSSNTSAARRIFSRYIRLTPALFVTLLFNAYIWDKLSTGPRWGTLVTKSAEICQESWWWNMLYLQNYFGLEEMCAPQTHQLALDMQLTIFGSILIWIFHVKEGMSKYILPAFHLLAVYSRYTITQEHRLTMLAYHGVSVSQLYRTARLSYTSILHRSTPYLVGISLGLALQTPKQHNKFIYILGWLFCVILWFGVWFSGMDSGSTNYRYDVTFAAQYAAYAPLASASAIAWLVYAVHNGCSELLSNILSCRILAIISRLSYALYLTQFVVFFTNAATVRYSTEFTLISLIDVQEISALLLSSVILTVTFIIPFQSLQKSISFSFSSEKPTEEEEAKPQEAENTEKVVESEEEIPVIKPRLSLIAHREVLEEIPEAEVEYEQQRDQLEGLQEILEEEEDEEIRDINESYENREHDDDEITIEDMQYEDELEVIEEEEAGEEGEEAGEEGEEEIEDDFWSNRDEEYTPRRLSYLDDRDDDDDLEPIRRTSTENAGQYYRYGR